LRFSEDKIDPEFVRDYLKSHEAALGFDFPLREYMVFKVLLDTADAHRLWLLQDTDARRKLVVTEANKETGPANQRVRRIILGDAAVGWGPLDIRNNCGFEIVLASNSFDSDCFNIWDGNHRAIAHWLTDGDFQGVPAYLCIHPKTIAWKKPKC
jgi:hypothetical protein